MSSVPGDTAISNTEDYIDSRDVEDRIEFLREQIVEFKNEGYDTKEEQNELDLLEQLKEDLEGDSEWEYGLTLINENYWQEYAEECAQDFGYIDRDKQYQWPFNCIDWEQAADELQMDYSEVDFNGTTFYYR
jgi:hypothetical protein